MIHKIIITYYLIIWFLIFKFFFKKYNYIDFTKAITVNAIAFSYTEKSSFYNTLTNAFNEYSRINNLDINLQLNILTPENSTTDITNYSSYLESLLAKKTPKYDIYFHYSSNSNIYFEHLVNLKQYFSDSYIEKFEKASITGSIFNNSLVGLVNINKSIFVVNIIIYCYLLNIVYLII